MLRKWSGSLLPLVAATLLATGCAVPVSEETNVEQTPPEEVAAVAHRLNGSLREAYVSENNQGICEPGDVLFVRVQQSPEGGAEAFNEATTQNVIAMIEAIKGETRDFALDYKACAHGVDRYGNRTNDYVHWLYYTVRDVQQINLGNRSYLLDNVLSMNTFGQNDVSKYFRGQ